MGKLNEDKQPWFPLSEELQWDCGVTMNFIMSFINLSS